MQTYLFILYPACYHSFLYSDPLFFLHLLCCHHHVASVTRYHAEKHHLIHFSCFTSTYRSPNSAPGTVLSVFLDCIASSRICIDTNDIPVPGVSEHRNLSVSAVVVHAHLFPLVKPVLSPPARAGLQLGLSSSIHGLGLFVNQELA